MDSTKQALIKRDPSLEAVDDSKPLMIAQSKRLDSSDEVIIRHLKQSDSRVLHRWWNDPNIMHHVGIPNGLNLSQEEINERVAALIQSKAQLQKRRVSLF